MSVKTFSAHVMVVLRLVVSEKRFSTHGRVWENRKIGEKTEKAERQRTQGKQGNSKKTKATE